MKKISFEYDKIVSSNENLDVSIPLALNHLDGLGNLKFTIPSSSFHAS